MKRALIFWAGWDGHQPRPSPAAQTELARRPRGRLSDTLACLDDAEALRGYDVIIPHWTMVRSTPDQTRNLTSADYQAWRSPEYAAAPVTPSAATPTMNG